MKLSLSATACVLLVLALLHPSTLHAQAKSTRQAKKPNPAFTPVTDDPNLPRVLLIGDSISIGYTIPTRQLLAGKVNVHRPLQNCGSTQTGLASLDQWLGDSEWDVIHFNWGLHDLKYVNDKQATPLKQYEANLRQLVTRLKNTHAKLIWCNTTPVPSGKLSPPRSDEDVQAYNAVAVKIMKEHGIKVNDLYAFALPRLKDIQRPSNVHFLEEGSQRLAEQVAKSVLAAQK